MSKPETSVNLAGTNNKEKPFKFSDEQTKALANKIADAFIQPSTSMRMAMTFVQVRPLLEKILPERAAVIKSREAESFASLPAEMKDMLSRAPLWDKNSTPEEILVQIAKLSEINRQDAYEPLLQRILEVEDDGRAKKLIDQIPDEKVRSAALEQYETKRIARTASAGKLDDARKLIGGLTKKSNQIKRLVALAIELQKKGGEKDIANAKSLMRDAKALTNEAPETDDDIDNVMEVVRGYATVDSDIAFRMFEPIIDQINDFVQASSVLARFDIYSTKFRKGELLMKVGSGNGGVEMLYRYIPQMQLLAKADLERMSTLADHFGRPDSQMIMRLYALQGFLKDPNKADESEALAN